MASRAPALSETTLSAVSQFPITPLILHNATPPSRLPLKRRGRGCSASVRVWYAVAMIEPPRPAHRQRNLRNTLFVLGVLLLAYGGPTALFVPYPAFRESYLHANTWPLLAIALSLALFVIVGGLTARSRGSKHLGIFVFNTICLGLAAVIGLWAVMVPIVAIVNRVLGALGYHASSAL